MGESNDKILNRMIHQKKVQHLFWRAGFGLDFKTLEEVAQTSIPNIVDELLDRGSNPLKIPHHPMVSKLMGERMEMSSMKNKDLTKLQRNKLRKEGRLIVGQINTDWIYRMASTDESPLLERMTLFWHGHFACESKLPHHAINQLNVIRQNALGNFKDLVLGIAKDASMIRYLNNQQNRKNSPNENFARELMELFTIGRGNYTEKDIKEAARAFTGWFSNTKGEFRFAKHQHDFSEKTFMGKTGNFDGADIIDIILKQKETATFVAQKVYSYFVNKKINTQHIQEMADVFYNSNYDIRSLMQYVFKADWFYARENIGSKIKSPIEFIAGLLKVLDVSFPDWKTLIFVQRALGQTLFRPPNVAGWEGGKAWIDNATLMFRLNIVAYLFQQSEVNFKEKEELEAAIQNKRRKKLQATVNLESLLSLVQLKSEDEILRFLMNGLLQTETKISKDTINRFTFHSDKKEFLKTALIRIMSLPEYQMC